MIDNHELLKTYRLLTAQNTIKPNREFEKLLQIHPVRSRSGIAIITLLTMPSGCPGRCTYCPTEVRMPKSYVASEPAAARALALQFDPYLQVENRIRILEKNAHAADKIELIIKGGTWSAYPKDYREWFIKECFRAMNEHSTDSVPEIINTNPQSKYNRFWGEERAQWSCQQLFDEEQKNETAAHRCIGLTIETRPDWVTLKEIAHLRSLGCTRVELGLQTTDEEILKNIKRGHTAEQTALATKLLKDAGFKVDHHLMPGLPGATVESDFEMAREVFTSPRFCPDTAKIYPCVILPSAELYEWYRQGHFTPYDSNTLVPLLAKIKSIVPPTVRLARIIRDFPSPEIAGGNAITNLRQTVQEYMRAHGMRCRCLRCREVGHIDESGIKNQESGIEYKCRQYEASDGMEYFLSYESPDESVLYAFLRLRLPSRNSEDIYRLFPELCGAALIRELHTYGTLVSINRHDKDASQHKGLGKQLLQKAECIAAENGYARCAVISGIGVREYYRKQGYELEDTYMVKKIKSPFSGLSKEEAAAGFEPAISSPHRIAPDSNH